MLAKCNYKMYDIYDKSRDNNSNAGDPMLEKSEVGTVFQTKRAVNAASIGAFFGVLGLLYLARCCSAHCTAMVAKPGLVLQHLGVESSTLAEMWLAVRLSLRSSEIGSALNCTCGASPTYRIAAKYLNKSVFQHWFKKGCRITS